MYLNSTIVFGDANDTLDLSESPDTVPTEPEYSNWIVVLFVLIFALVIARCAFPTRTINTW